MSAERIKEWILLVGSVVVTVALATGLIGWFAPRLLGLPTDLQLVSVGKAVPSFYEGVFRREDYASRDYLLNDPYTRVRAKPLFPETAGMGPNDILGFRNRGIPNVADIVCIGDSQTYGNNVSLEQNWPSRLLVSIEDKRPILYNASTGGWGGVQYLDVFSNITLLRPRVVVVAFYSGNDSLESFTLAYGSERWASLRLDPELSAGDAPSVAFPPSEDDLWRVEFDDGAATVLTPALRLSANQDHPAVRAGYAIMAEVARQMSVQAAGLGIHVIYTIIPTKELAYAPRLSAAGFEGPPAFAELVEREQRNIAGLGEKLARLESSTYVDVVQPLQDAAMGGVPLYPANHNGHPVAGGYQVIGQTLAAAVDVWLPDRVSGLVAISAGGRGAHLALVTRDGVSLFDSVRVAEANGWSLDQIRVVPPRDVATLPRRAVIEEVDPNRFGPGALAAR